MPSASSAADVRFVRGLFAQKAAGAGIPGMVIERSKGVDEEISVHVIDFLDRNDPKKTNKPFFVWYNPARMHVTTVLNDKYMAMVGEPGGKDWGGASANQVPDCHQSQNGQSA
jgi:hypothetical protein